MLGINKLLGFMSRQIGLRTDAASSTGNLHAKTKDIKDFLSGSVLPGINKIPWASGKSVSIIKGSHVASNVQGNGAYQSSVTITGPKIILLGWVAAANSGNYVYTRLRIDGNNMFDVHNQTYVTTYGSYKWGMAAGYEPYMGSTAGFRNPLDFSNYYTGSAPDSRAPGTYTGLHLTLPLMLPIQSSLSLEYMITSPQYSSLSMHWGFWVVDM